MFWNTRQVLKLLYEIRHEQKHQHRLQIHILEQNEALMSKTSEAVDRIIELARPLIRDITTLTEALRAANEREAAAKAELAEFRSTDAADDAAQLAAQDEATAREADLKAGNLAAEIAAIKGAEEPVDPEPVDEPVDPEPVDEPVDPEPVDPEPVDEPVDPEPVDLDEVPPFDENPDLGAGDPPVETPEVNDDNSDPVF